MSKPPYNHNLVDTSKAIIASVDFETLDIHPTAVITGLGAVIEGPRRRWTTSHFPISAHEQFGRTMSPDTVTFWRTRYDNDLRLAFESSMAGKGITLRDALDSFLKQCEAAIQYHDKVAGPGHSIYWIYKPAIFDGALLYHACCYFGDAWEKRLDAVSGGPYRRHALDLNSMQFLANMVGVQVPEFPKPGKLHDPTSDADAQLKAFRLVQAALRAQVTNTVAVGPLNPEPEKPRGERVAPGVSIDGKEPVLFAMVRPKDETGVSGTGHVLDGVIWPGSGRVQVQWRSDTSSLNTYECYDDFYKVHVASHPANETMILFNPQAHDDSRFYSGALPPKAASATPPTKPKSVFITGKDAHDFAAEQATATPASHVIETVVRDVITGKSVSRAGPRVLKVHNGVDDLDDDGTPTIVYQGLDVDKVLSGMLEKGKAAATYEFVDEAAGSWPAEGAGDGTPDKPRDKYAGKPDHAAANWQPE